MAIREKTVVIMKQEGVSRSHARTDLSIRDLQVVIDEPVARGGTNQGASPTETLMAAQVGCTNVIGHKCAEKHGVHIKAMDIKLEAQFDRRGVTLAEEVDVPFPEIRLVIDVTTDASREEVDKVAADLGRYCAVAKVIRQSGTVINEEWNIIPG